MQIPLCHFCYITSSVFVGDEVLNFLDRLEFGAFLHTSLHAHPLRKRYLLQKYAVRDSPLVFLFSSTEYKGLFTHTHTYTHLCVPCHTGPSICNAVAAVAA